MKKLILVFICLLFITGCTNQEKAYNPFTESPYNSYRNLGDIEKGQTIFVNNQVVVNDFKDEFIRITESLSSFEGKIFEVFLNFEFLENEKWQSEISSLKNQSDMVINEIEKLTIPRGLQGIHSELYRMAIEFDRSIRLLERFAASDRKLDYLKGSKNSLERAISLQNHLLELFNEGVSEKIEWNAKSIYN